MAVAPKQGVRLSLVPGSVTALVRSVLGVEWLSEISATRGAGFLLTLLAPVPGVELPQRHRSGALESIFSACLN